MLNDTREQRDAVDKSVKKARKRIKTKRRANKLWKKRRSKKV